MVGDGLEDFKDLTGWQFEKGEVGSVVAVAQGYTQDLREEANGRIEVQCSYSCPGVS